MVQLRSKTLTSYLIRLRFAERLISNDKFLITDFVELDKAGGFQTIESVKITSKPLRPEIITDIDTILIKIPQMLAKNKNIE